MVRNLPTAARAATLWRFLRRARLARARRGRRHRQRVDCRGASRRGRGCAQATSHPSCWTPGPPAPRARRARTSLVAPATRRTCIPRTPPSGVVISAMRAMLAPRRRAWPDQLVRVCGPGGRRRATQLDARGHARSPVQDHGAIRSPAPAGGRRPRPPSGATRSTCGAMSAAVCARTPLERGDVLEITAFERPREYREHFKARYGPRDRRPCQRRARHNLIREFDAALDVFCDDWKHAARPSESTLLEGVPPRRGHARRRETSAATARPFRTGRVPCRAHGVRRRVTGPAGAFHPPRPTPPPAGVDVPAASGRARHGRFSGAGLGRIARPSPRLHGARAAASGADALDRHRLDRGKRPEWATLFNARGAARHGGGRVGGGCAQGGWLPMASCASRPHPPLV